MTVRFERIVLLPPNVRANPARCGKACKGGPHQGVLLLHPALTSLAAAGRGLSEGLGVIASAPERLSHDWIADGTK